MRIKESYICLSDVRFHAFHGVMLQERNVGADFVVSVRVGVDISKAVDSDKVEDTLNYAVLYDIMKREMSIPSNLLEYVAGRIGRSIIEQFPMVSSVDVRVTKANPPIGADSNGAGVELHLINDKTET